MVDDVCTISKCGVQSVENNAYTTSKFEMFKLELNAAKCKQIHVGKNENCCPNLKTHSNIMIKDNEEKYLGDVISSDGRWEKCKKYPTASKSRYR